MMFIEDASARASTWERAWWIRRGRLFTAVTFTSAFSWFWWCQQ